VLSLFLEGTRHECLVGVEDQRCDIYLPSLEVDEGKSGLKLVLSLIFFTGSFL
jgi:hypothetical protein